MAGAGKHRITYRLLLLFQDVYKYGIETLLLSFLRVYVCIYNALHEVREREREELSDKESTLLDCIHARAEIDV